MYFAQWLRLIRNTTFFIIIEQEKWIFFSLNCSLVVSSQCCRETRHWKQHGCCRLLQYSMCCTFAFISSKPTVATVLVCCLFFFSSFCGLSRRCSRCLITWFHPWCSSGEGERAEMREGDKRSRAECSRVKSSFTVMSALQSLPLILLYPYVWQSAGRRLQSLKGDTAETGVHSMSSVSSESSAQTGADISFSGLEIKSNQTPHMHNKH